MPKSYEELGQKHYNRPGTRKFQDYRNVFQEAWNDPESSPVMTNLVQRNSRAQTDPIPVPALCENVLHSSSIQYSLRTCEDEEEREINLNRLGLHKVTPGFESFSTMSSPQTQRGYAFGEENCYMNQAQQQFGHPGGQQVQGGYHNAQVQQPMYYDPVPPPISHPGGQGSSSNMYNLPTYSGLSQHMNSAGQMQYNQPAPGRFPGAPQIEYPNQFQHQGLSVRSPPQHAHSAPNSRYISPQNMGGQNQPVFPQQSRNFKRRNNRKKRNQQSPCASQPTPEVETQTNQNEIPQIYVNDQPSQQYLGESSSALSCPGTNQNDPSRDASTAEVLELRRKVSELEQMIKNMAQSNYQVPEQSSLREIPHDPRMMLVGNQMISLVGLTKEELQNQLIQKALDTNIFIMGTWNQVTNAIAVQQDCLEKLKMVSNDIIKVIPSETQNPDAITEVHSGSFNPEAASETVEVNVQEFDINKALRIIDAAIPMAVQNTRNEDEDAKAEDEAAELIETPILTQRTENNIDEDNKDGAVVEGEEMPEVLALPLDTKHIEELTEQPSIPQQTEHQVNEDNEDNTVDGEEATLDQEAEIPELSEERKAQQKAIMESQAKLLKNRIRLQHYLNARKNGQNQGLLRGMKSPQKNKNVNEDEKPLTSADCVKIIKSLRQEKCAAELDDFMFLLDNRIKNVEFAKYIVDDMSRTIPTTLKKMEIYYTELKKVMNRGTARDRYLNRQAAQRRGDGQIQGVTQLQQEMTEAAKQHTRDLPRFTEMPYFIEKREKYEKQMKELDSLEGAHISIIFEILMNCKPEHAPILNFDFYYLSEQKDDAKLKSYLQFFSELQFGTEK